MQRRIVFTDGTVVHADVSTGRQAVLTPWGHVVVQAGDVLVPWGNYVVPVPEALFERLGLLSAATSPSAVEELPAVPAETRVVQHATDDEDDADDDWSAPPAPPEPDLDALTYFELKKFAGQAFPGLAKPGLDRPTLIAALRERMASVG